MIWNLKKKKVKMNKKFGNWKKILKIINNYSILRELIGMKRKIRKKLINNLKSQGKVVLWLKKSKINIDK